MPLSERARIEIYLPDLPVESYQNLLSVFQQELTYAFGGCSVLRDVEGGYLSFEGAHISDRVSILYADAPFEFEENFMYFRNMPTSFERLHSKRLTKKPRWSSQSRSITPSLQ